MVAFGVTVGALFPPAIMLLGVPQSVTVRPVVYAATLTAGLMVGAVNYLLARRVVGSRIRTLAARMRHVGDVMHEAAHTGDWSRCTPANCMLPVDSADEIGDAAAGFNGLLEAVHDARGVESSLSGFASAIATHLTLDRLADVMLRNMLACLDANGGALLTADSGVWTVRASQHLHAELIAAPPVQVALARRSVAVIPPSELVATSPNDPQQPAFVVVVPLQRSTADLGRVVLRFSEHPSPTTHRLIDVLRDTASVALHNALVHERLHTLATTDSLTGVFNRGSGLARLHEEWRRAERDNAPLAVLMIDLDHFKRVNDTYGHRGGDRVLQEVAKFLHSAVGGGDTVLRTGGEEFAIVLPSADAGEAQRVGERLFEGIAALVVAVGAAKIRVTVSVGGASYPEHPCAGAEELLHLADEALYRAKQQGRNRVSLGPATDATTDHGDRQTTREPVRPSSVARS